MQPFAPIDAYVEEPASTYGGADPEALLQGLNERQRQAVEATDGPVMIVAGPGSGKTRTLTHRIAYLLAIGKARPWEVLALTFTNKAAREMKARVETLVGPESAKGMWMGTFHSMFARVLRREAEKIGFSRDFSIYDTDDTERVLRMLMEQHGVDKKQASPRAVRSAISSAKNQLLGPEKYAELANGFFEETVAKLYGPYVEALKRANAMDFDDLLGWPLRLFEQFPETLEKYQDRWRFIHIDEYQDTNRVQYRLANLLAARHNNLCVVGDDAQSIYAFRGADIRNILSFEKDYPEAKLFRLEQNYRSTQQILRLADAIIKNNKGQIEKTLWTENPTGDAVLLMEALSEKDEAQKIERRIRDLQARRGYRNRNFAILYRTNAQSRSFEEALRRGGISYRIVGGVSFYQRAEIKDALAYLRVAVNPADDASLLRIINTPTRGIGAKTIERLQIFASEKGISLWNAAKRVRETEVGSRGVSAVESFCGMMEPFQGKVGEVPADELAKDILEAGRLMQALRDENTPESLARLDNIQELLNAVAEFSSDGNRTLTAFLQEVSLVADVDSLDEEEDRVTLMTLHASKGLEFKVVFVTGLEEGLFPLSVAAQDPDELEEERRLFYVGCTRAEESLFLSFARSRYRYGEQQSSLRSRFLDELEGEDELILTETGKAFHGKPGRFKLGKEGGNGYGQMDPHYYRRNLRTEKRNPSRGRRIVYEEGERPIVPGVEVEHGTFGTGKVLNVDGSGEQTTATVFFPDVGQKRLKLKFARLQVVD